MKEFNWHQSLSNDWHISAEELFNLFTQRMKDEGLIPDLKKYYQNITFSGHHPDCAVFRSPGTACTCSAQEYR